MTHAMADPGTWLWIGMALVVVRMWLHRRRASSLFRRRRSNWGFPLPWISGSRLPWATDEADREQRETQAEADRLIRKYKAEERSRLRR